MPSSIYTAIAVAVALLLAQHCTGRWNFFDTNGRRIRHNRYWKLGQYQFEQSIECMGKRSSAEFATCPKKKCHTNQDCWQATGSAQRCLCDRILCGLVCVSIDARCEALDDLLNGKVNITPSSQPGGLALYSCNEGFALKGAHKRVCKANGKWTDASPSCVSQSYCDRPPTVARATHDADPHRKKFASGTIVKYRCQEGFYYRGDYAQAICSGGDQWIGPQIKCRPVSCGHPGSLPNGRRIGDEFFYKRKVVYLCDEGYKVACSKHDPRQTAECQVRVCQANGKWSGSQPVCRPIRCPRLPAPYNGRVSGMWTKVNSILTFSCNPGYYLVGSRTRRCLHHGEWDGGNATCKIWNCGLPPFVPHSRLNYSNTIYGSKARYRCVPDSSFSGESDVLECGPDGIWTPEPPKCLSHCSLLKVTNGTVQVDNISLSAGADLRRQMVPHAVTVRVECTGGYQLRTPVFPRCQNGSWSVAPRCEPAPCPSRPPIGVNAQARFYSLAHGAKASYACYLGYNRTAGDEVLHCQFGQWIGKPPFCRPTTCSRPRSPKNGMIYLVGTHGSWQYTSPSIRPRHDDMIEYRCRPGYRINGQQNAVCLNGEWRPTETPECELVLHKTLPLEWVLYHPRKRRAPS